jgi:4-amino-4-deoxy-L-arabinose transferase-like glycosyltransferase
LEYGTYAYSLETPRTPEIVRTPGYPTFLAGAYLVLGRSQVRAVLLQLLVSVLTVALVYRVARLRWGSSGAGLAAALFAALDVVSFVYALRLLTETLAAFCQALLLLAAFRAWRRIDDRWSPLLLGGALTAVTLMRPTTYYLVVPMAAWIALLALRDHLGARRTARAVGLFVLPFVLVIGGWAARNWAWTGYFEYSFITGMNMLFYKGAGVIALRDGISLGEAQQKVGRTSYHDVPHEDRPELFVRYRKEAAELLAAHPWLYLRVVADGVHDTLLDHGGHHLFHVLALGPKERGAFARPVVRFASRYLLVLYACIAVCLFGLAATRSGTLFDALTLGTLAYIVLVSAGPEAYCRFRVPLMPILAVYAAGGLGWAFRRPGRDRST